MNAATKMNKMKPFGYSWAPRPGLLPAVVHAVQHVDRQAWNCRAPIVHACWVLDYAFTPLGVFWAGRDRRHWRERPARVAHLYPPHTPYWEDRRPTPPPMRSAAILFQGGEIAGLDRLIPPSLGYARFLDPQALTGNLIRQAAEIGRQHQEAGFWKAQALLCEILHLLQLSRPVAQETYRIQAEIPHPVPSPLVAAVNAYLEAHWMERVSLTALAKRLHVSVSTITHRYCAETGRAPIAALLALRIQAAKNALIKGQRLKAIAAETGFSDAYHLSKTFKHVTGLTPRQFLRALGATPPPALLSENVKAR